jgi:hypothetical protein
VVRTPEGMSEQDAQREAEAILTRLAGSTALLPQELPPDADPLPEGTVGLPVVEQDGTQYVPVFTRRETLVAAGADPETAVEVPLAQLAAGWPEEELWLAVDPASEDGLTLPPDVVRALPGFVA